MPLLGAPGEPSWGAPLSQGHAFALRAWKRTSRCPADGKRQAFKSKSSFSRMLSGSRGFCLQIADFDQFSMQKLVGTARAKCIEIRRNASEVLAARARASTLSAHPRERPSLQESSSMQQCSSAPFRAEAVESHSKACASSEG